jgi:flotillin
VWPIIQESTFLSLEPIQISTQLEGALSLENIRVNVPSIWTIAISIEERVMPNAAIVTAIFTFIYSLFL